MNIEQLVKKAKSKDEDAINEIIKMFTPLILKMVKSIYIKGNDRDDLIQMGYMSIVKAINSYDLGSNSSFVAYLSNAVRYNYYYEIRKASKRNFDTSYDKSLEEGTDLGMNEDLGDSIEDVIIRKAEYEKLRQALGELSKEERELLKFAFFKDFGGMKKYEKITGIKYGTLQKRKRTLLKKLRDLLNKK